MEKSWYKTKINGIYVNKEGKVSHFDGINFIELSFKKKNKFLRVKIIGSTKFYCHVHRLIAETFIPNLKNYKYVIHKDGNYHNNHVDNLSWNPSACKPGTKKIRDVKYLKAKVIKDCLQCSNPFIVRVNRKKFCSVPCRCRFFAPLAGRIAAQTVNKRGKNEVLFYEMCKTYFKNDVVLSNEVMFNGWDADVIISSLKIAVLWNGIHHYKQIQKGQSLSQVQNRDRIKIKEIKKMGYLPIVIKDLKKHNPKFVAEKFNEFLVTLKKHNIIIG